jgi:hypothetical protein
MDTRTQNTSSIGTVATSPRCGRAARLALLAVAALAALAAAATPAHAFTVRSQSTPGSIQVPKLWSAILFAPYRGPSDIFDLNEFARDHGGGSDFVAYFPKRYVWRSNAYSGSQVVTVQYRVFHKNRCHSLELDCAEQWTLHRSVMETVSVPAGRASKPAIPPTKELGPL